MGLKSFWETVTQYFDNGRVKVKMKLVKAPSLPKSFVVEKSPYDEYHDYHASYEQALKWMQDAKRA